MNSTYAVFDMEFIDVTAIADSTITTSSNSTFADKELLKVNESIPDYGTAELNQFVLDGSYDEFPNTPDNIAYWSSDMSDSDGLFTVNPSITVAFTENHSSAGIMLYFFDSFARKMKITWYTLGGTKLYEEIFNPDSLDYFCSRAINNYGKVVIEFMETDPYRYVKLQYIKYGVSLEWSDTELKTAKLVEELDPTSSTLSINKGTLEMIDKENMFNVADDDAFYKLFQSNQPGKLREYVNGNMIEMGSFFLDTWSNSKSIVKMSIIDPIGLIDKTKFYDGKVYVNELAGDIIDAIMESAGYSDYSVADDVRNTMISGHIPISTHRKALQLVVFACGAVADCSRSGTIQIYKHERYIGTTINRDRKFNSSSIKIDDYISDVSIKYSTYTLQAEISEIYKGTLPIGDTRIELSSPCSVDGLTASAGTLKDIHPNYFTVSMTEAGESIVSGYKYNKNDAAISSSIEKIDAGETRKTKSFTTTVMTADLAIEMAKQLLDYYQLRQIVSLKYVMENDRVGRWAQIEYADAPGSYAVSGLEKQNIDLSGGFISTTTARGYNKITTNYYYTGEIYFGDEIGVM